MNTIAWRVRFVALVAAVAALWLGGKIAQAEFFWPVLAVGLLGALTLSLLQPLPIGTLLLGCAVFGYVVGNRGFAQLSLTGSFPLLPAEFVLLVAGGILAAQSAMRRELPIRRDLLNMAVLLWMAVSSARLYLDLRSYGAMALRDHATVYYATFFFLAQKAGGAESERRFLKGSLFAGCIMLLVVYPLSVRFPDFFLEKFVFRGVPLIFLKGDLAGTFMAVGSILCFLRFEERRSRWALGISLVLAGLILTTNNRASMLSLAVPAVLLAAGGRRLFLAALGCAGVGAALVLLIVSQARDQPWEKTVLHDVYEQVVSMADPFGERTYSGEDTSFKGDNNVFRSMWWRITIDDTLRIDPWFGQGWGSDLADPFVQIYYPEGGEDFSARSPHNIFITLFARTGVVGLLPFLAIVAVIAMRSVRAIRSDHESVGMWCTVWSILTSACFGVVLEGPMGAVVFWTALGLASAQTPEPRKDEPAAESSGAGLLSQEHATIQGKGMPL